jgi:hypothetical protein
MTKDNGSVYNIQYHAKPQNRKENLTVFFLRTFLFSFCHRCLVLKFASSHLCVKVKAKETNFDIMYLYVCC